MFDIIKATLAAGAVCFSAAAAQAATIDFTKSSTGSSGLVDGVGWTMTATNGTLNNSEKYDGKGKPTTSLALERDGYGVSGDEITGPKKQAITITFDSAVRITGVAALDLYANRAGTDREVLNFSTDSGSGSIAGVYSGGTNGGYAFADGLSFVTNSITFYMGVGKDDGNGDAALAAVSVAAVPLPASALLMLAGFGGLAAVRRKKA